MKRIIADQAKELASLKTQTENARKQAQNRAEAEAESRAINELLNRTCSRIEKEVDAVGLRNEALVEFKKRTSEEGVPSPAEAALILESVDVHNKLSTVKPSKDTK
jgi:hypothetical protein